MVCLSSAGEECGCCGSSAALGGGAEGLGAEPVGQAGDEEAIHPDEHEYDIAGLDAGDGEGDMFIGGETVEIRGGEGDADGFAGGAGGGDPFPDEIR